MESYEVISKWGMSGLENKFFVLYINSSFEAEQNTLKKCSIDAQNMWGCFKEAKTENALNDCWFVFNLQIGKLILTCFHIPITATFK